MKNRDYLTRPGQKDYQSMRSDYRHQRGGEQRRENSNENQRDNQQSSYGNYNPASGTYENRADNLPPASERMDQQFTNEYQQDLSYGSQRGYGTPSPANYGERYTQNAQQAGAGQNRGQESSRQFNEDYRRSEGRGYGYSGDDHTNDVRVTDYGSGHTGNINANSYGPGNTTGESRGMNGGYEPHGYRTSSYQSESEGNYQQRSSQGPWQGQQQQQNRPQQGRHAGKGPKGYKRSEERILEEASEKLMSDHHIDASNIELSFEQGVLVLRGTVEDRVTKRGAEDCVSHISGVHDIRNELRVDSINHTPGGPDQTSMMSSPDSANAAGKNDSARSESNKSDKPANKKMQ